VHFSPADVVAKVAHAEVQVVRQGLLLLLFFDGPSRLQDSSDLKKN
jgi:hypothetical protein